jgi:general secretion pathway protein H
VGPVAGGKSSAAASRGFTLIEILVVVALLAVAGAVATLALVPDERGILEREARRFAGALEYAALRAQLRHETLGVLAVVGDSGSGWRFVVRAADGRWQPVAGDDALDAHALPPSVAVQPLAYAGRDLPADAIVPLRASGRNEPYAFALRSTRFDATVSADPLNRVLIVGPQAR